MDHLNRNSSGSLLREIGCCLICCSDSKTTFLTTELNSSTKNYDSKRLTKAIETIFEYLQVPKEHIVKVKRKQSLLSFCPNCMVIVEEIIELQKKTEILELQIKWKVETLGRIAIDSPAFTRNSGSNEKHVAEVWSTFKSHVIHNFLQGSLPNPSVRLEKAVNADQVERNAGLQLGRVNDRTSANFQKCKTNKNSKKCENQIGDKKSCFTKLSTWLSTDRSLYSKNFGTNFANKEDRLVVKIEDEDDDNNSNDNLFEVVTDQIEDSMDLKQESAKEEDSITVEDKIWVGLGDTNEMFEPYGNIDCDSTHTRSKRQKLSVVPRPKKSTNDKNFQEKTITPFVNTKDPEEVTKEFELIEGRDYVKCTKCNYFARKKPTSSYIQNRPSSLRADVADHYSWRHNPVKPANRSKTVDDKYCYKCTKCTFSIVCPSQRICCPDRDTSLRKLSLHYMDVHDHDDSSDFDHGLTNTGQKRQKCDETTIPVNIHTSTESNNTPHVIPTTINYIIPDPDEVKNQVDGLIQEKPLEETKTSDKRTKCSVSEILQSGRQNKNDKSSSSQQNMEELNAIETHSNSSPDDTLKNFKKEIDYFSCPFAYCKFKAFIKKEECQKQNLKNATEARFKIVEHFRTTRKHFGEHKNALSEITSKFSVDEKEAKELKSYKCTKCDFRSFYAKFDKHDKEPRYQTQKVLVVHFLLEHVFPWKKFPGLYKYGCYEEKSESGNNLKCYYSDCHYSVKVQYDLEGKNEEECELAAYQSFSEHALSHNFNSIGFDYGNQSFTEDESTEEVLNVASQDIELSAKLNDVVVDNKRKEKRLIESDKSIKRKYKLEQSIEGRNNIQLIYNDHVEHQSGGRKRPNILRKKIV